MVRVLVVVFALASVLVACSGGEDPPPDSVPSSAVAVVENPTIPDTDTPASTGAIEGRIVGLTDQVALGRWAVAASPRGELDPSKPLGEIRRVPLGRNGEFRIEGLPPGMAKLDANGPGWMRVDGPVVSVHAGGTVNVTVVGDATNTTGGIQIHPTIHVANLDRSPWAPRVLPRFLVVGDDGTEYGYTDHFGPNGPRVIADLPLGEYTLRLDDPQFLPWPERRVRTGEAVKAQLYGSVSLQLLVVERDTGALIDEFEATLIEEDGLGGDRWELEPGETTSEGERIFPHLLPCDYALLVSAPPHPAKYVRLGALVPGETRRREIRMGGGPAIRGTARDVYGDPVADVRVELIEAGRDPDAERMPYAWRRQDTRDGKDHLFLAELSSSPDGEFEFSGFPPGEYLLWAPHDADDRPPLEAMFGPVSVRDEEIVEGVDLVLPSEFGSITGRILWPEGASPPRAFVTADPHSWLEPVVTEVLSGDDWRFHLENVPMGHSDLEVSLWSEGDVPASPWISDLPYGTRTLGVVEVHSGEEATLEYDASRIAPGGIRVRVRSGETPLPGTELRIIDLSPISDEWGLARTDDAGEAYCYPLFPGRWAIVARNPEEDWICLHPEIVEVSAGKEVACRIDAQRWEGALEIRRFPTGDPWAGEAFELAPFLASNPDRDLGLRIDGHTDAAGTAHLSLPVGTYRLRTSWLDYDLDSGEGWRTEIVEWTESGPEPSTITLR